MRTLKAPLVHVRSSVDYGNTKTLRVNRRLGSATLSQRAFPREKQPEFPMGEIPMGQYRCLKKKKKSVAETYHWYKLSFQTSHSKRQPLSHCRLILA